jgi:hypothetical protein
MKEEYGGVNTLGSTFLLCNLAYEYHINSALWLL